MQPFPVCGTWWFNTERPLHNFFAQEQDATRNRGVLFVQGIRAASQVDLTKLFASKNRYATVSLIDKGAEK
jgi:hypothetical protein